MHNAQLLMRGPRLPHRISALGIHGLALQAPKLVHVPVLGMDRWAMNRHRLTSHLCHI